MATRQTPSASFLVADDRAESVKDITIRLRGFFADCLVEAAYSSQDLAYVASRREWDITFLDERLLDAPVQALTDLRRHAPQTTILVLGEREDWQWAQRILKHGADSYLCRTSPSFESQLLLTSKLLLERRQLTTRLERSEHYLALIEQLSDVVYELDPLGRFLHVSPAVTPLLGYQPDELIGQPYSLLLAGEDQARAAGRVNERRTGDRATRHFELRMVGRKPGSAPTPVEVELSATGLYGPQREFLGTVGLLKDASRLVNERRRALTLEQQLQQSQQAHQADMAMRQAAERYRASLTGISAESERLLSALQTLGLETRLRKLYENAASALETPAADTSSPPSSSSTATIQLPPGTPAPSAAVVPPAPPPPTPLQLVETPIAPAGPILTDRRRTARLVCTLPTKIQHEGQSWEGFTRDLSLGGMLVTCAEPLPVGEGHPVQISLNSEIGLFELRGTVHAIREWEDPRKKEGRRPAMGLAIEFGPFGPYEEQILGSLIQGLTEQAIQLQATVTITPLETGQPSPTDGTFPESLSEDVEDAPRLGDLGTSLSPERRLEERANAVMQVRLEPCGPALSIPTLSGRTTNVSVSGCCLSVQAVPALVGTRARLTFLPQPAGSSRGSKQGRQPISLLGEVLWSAADPAAPPGLRDGDLPPHRVGIRFLHLDRESEQRLRDLMARLLPNGESPVVSVTAECTNETGQRLAIVHDHPRRRLPPGSPVVIISPGFGETKREWVGLAHWLCLNGFHVLRYDHSCHVGDSDGPMERTTLSAMQQDLRAIIDLAERLLPASPLTIIGHNVSGRIALRAAVSDTRIKLLVLLAGVVDLESTLQSVHHEDLIAGYRTGTRLGRANLFGFTVDTDRWLGDAISGRYCTLAETIADAELVPSPVIFLAAEKDPWVPLDSLKAVQNALRSQLRQLSLLVDTPGRLRDHPRTARPFLRRIVSSCIERFYPLAPKGQITPADPQLSIRQMERERIRSRQRHSLAKPDLVDFWQTYLDHFQSAARSSEFWRLYDHVYRLLGATDKGGMILDAGCGHADFGMLLALNHAYRGRTAGGGTPWSTTYVGLDMVPAALQHASRQLTSVADEIRSKFPTTHYAHVLLRSALMAADLEQPLPYRDGQFDRVVCNLTLSFLRDPVSTLRELMRVLTPGGRLIITVFSRRADLSSLFASVMQRAARPEDVEEARWLWMQWGLIREAEANGAFRFFDRQDLIQLFKACGAPRPRLYTALNDQCLIVVAEKSVR